MQNGPPLPLIVLMWSRKQVYAHGFASITIKIVSLMPGHGVDPDQVSMRPSQMLNLLKRSAMLSQDNTRIGEVSVRS